MYVIKSHSVNANSATVATPSGIVKMPFSINPSNCLSFLQPLNASLLMLVRFPGSNALAVPVTVSRFSQYLNVPYAPLTIFVTSPRNVILVTLIN